MLSDELKVGDKVVISRRWNNESIGTVTEITKAGNIRVGNTLYKSNGRLRGGDSWSYDFIYKATDGEIKRIKEEQVVTRCLNRLRKLTTLTYEQAKQINQILESEE